MAGRRGYLARKQKYTDALFGCFLFSDCFFLSDFSLILDSNAQESGRAPRRSTEMIPDEEMQYGEYAKEQLGVLGLYPVQKDNWAGHSRPKESLVVSFSSSLGTSGHQMNLVEVKVVSRTVELFPEG